MPWAIKDVDKHNKGLSDKQKKQWVAVANSALKSCMDKGGEESKCAASAIQQANGVVGNNMQIYSAIQDDYKVKTKKLNGKDYLVVPIVMMKEGVHEGSHGALLHQISELGKFPDSWNGIPVVIRHPQVDGQNVSANSPEILEEVGVGQIFHTKVNGSKLKSEAWLEKDKLEENFPNIYESISNNEVLEVSVGVFTDDQEVNNGDWNGEVYTAIARNHRPDHLAILPDQTGACSVDDGCGLGVNEKKGGKNMTNNAIVTGMEKMRDDMGMSVEEFYAIPRDPPSDSKLPMFDEAHVRNALARMSQMKGVSAEEMASAKKKLLAKAKKFKIDATSLENNSHEVTDYTAEGLGERLQELRDLINSLDDNSTYHYLEEAYDDYLIYCENPKQGGGERKIYKQNYQENLKTGEYELTGDPIEVEKQVTYIPIKTTLNNYKKGGTMSKEGTPCGQCMEKVVKIINNNHAGMTKEDREWLLTQDETVLDRILAKPAGINANNSKPSAEVTAEQIINVLKAMKPEDRLALLPDEDREIITYGKNEKKLRRANLTKGIQDNTSKEDWPDDVLANMSEDQLTRLYKSVKREAPVDYSLNGGNGGSINNNEEDFLLPTGVELEQKGGK